MGYRCVAPSLAALKIEFGRSTTKFFLALQDHPPPYLRSRLQFLAPPWHCNYKVCTPFKGNFHRPHYSSYPWSHCILTHQPGIGTPFWGAYAVTLHGTPCIWRPSQEVEGSPGDASWTTALHQCGHFKTRRIHRKSMQNMHIHSRNGCTLFFDFYFISDPTPQQ